MKSEEILRWRQEVHDARMMSIQLQAIDVPGSVEETVLLPSPQRVVWPGGKSIDDLLSIKLRACKSRSLIWLSREVRKTIAESLGVLAADIIEPPKQMRSRTGIAV